MVLILLDHSSSPPAGAKKWNYRPSSSRAWVGMASCFISACYLAISGAALDADTALAWGLIDCVDAEP